MEQISSNVLAYEILRQIVLKPAQYNKTPEGLVQIESMMLKMVQANMPSKAGAVDKAVIVGAMMASGWIEENQEMILKQRVQVHADLFKISMLLFQVAYKGQNHVTSLDRRTDEELIYQGFQKGISLGRRIKKMSYGKPMATSNVLSALCNIEDQINLCLLANHQKRCR